MSVSTGGPGFLAKVPGVTRDTAGEQELQPAPPRRPRRIPKVIWMVTGLWVALLLGASIVWPMGYGYDEPQHIDMAYDYAYHPFEFYGPGQLQPTQANTHMQSLLAGFPPEKSLGDVPIAPRSSRPSFQALGGPKKVSGAQPNQMDQHPPLYYWLQAVLLRLPGVSHLAWDLQVWLMRVLSVVMMAPVPLLGWAAARRLMAPPGEMPQRKGTAEWMAVVAALLPFTCAGLIRDGAAVTNDALLISLTSVLVYLMARVTSGDRSIRTAGLVAVTLAAALWTKGTALAYPPFVLAAYLVGGVGSGLAARIRSMGRPIAVMVAGCVVGGVWWLRNLIDYGTVQPNGFGKHYREILYGRPDHSGSFIYWAPNFLDTFIRRIWGGIGILDSPSIGGLVEYGWPVLLGGAVLVALFARGRSEERRRAWVLGGMALAVFLVIVFGSFNTNREWSLLVSGTQGRYMYPSFTALAALAVVGVRRVVRPMCTKWVPPLVLFVALLTNAAAWLIILRSWYKPKAASARSLGGLHPTVSSLLRWSPLPEGLTILFVFVLPLICGVAVFAHVVNRSGRVAIRPELPGPGPVRSAGGQHDQHTGR